MTTSKSTNSLIDLRMDSVEIIDQIRTKINFLSSNGDDYIFRSSLDDFIDMKHQFNVFIEGRINELHTSLINRAIVYTWNLTAYQTKTFVNFFSKNYQFTFLSKNELEIDLEGNLQTKITYFISSNGKYAKPEDFELVPKTSWLQDSIQKYDLPYFILDGNDLSVKSYEKLYYIDFDGYIDPTNEEEISENILNSFRETYTDIQFIGLTFMMKEKRIGEYGNNVTRLLYFLEDFNDNILDSYEYRAPNDHINAALSHNYVVYKQTSRPVDEYYVAYAQSWSMPNLDDLISLFTNTEKLNVSKINGEVVLMEKFLNVNQKKFSKVYIRISGSQEDAKLLTARARSVSKARLFIKASNDSGDSSSTQITTINSNQDNLLFKLRTIYFKNALPVYKQNVVNILEKAWLSKLDKKKFESQNGLRVLVNIFDVANYLTTKNEEVYGYRYTVSVNGQDPEFLGVTEPTFAEFEHETEAQSEKTLKFCPYSAFEIERVYISAKNDSTEHFESKINEILTNVWNQLNDIEMSVYNRGMTSNRIIGKCKLDTGYYNVLKQSINRLALTWLVDGSIPNPVYFKRPTLDDVLPYLSNAGINIYEGTPLINQTIEISPGNTTSFEQIKLGLLSGWRKANPGIKQDAFYLLVETNERPVDLLSISKRDASAKLSTSTNAIGAEQKPTNIIYFVGIKEKLYDSSEIRKPTLKMLQEELKRIVQDIKFADDQTQNEEIFINSNTNSDRDNIFSNLDQQSRKNSISPVSWIICIYFFYLDRLDGLISYFLLE